MARQSEDVVPEISMAIHQYYMDIINCMPNIVYWIDLNCELKGSNNNFVKLLGLKHINDFHGSPYELLSKFSHWPLERVEAMKLDDMSAIFSGEAKYNVDETPVYDKEGRASYYTATRVPLFDNQKRVTGLVVILNDVTERKVAAIANPKSISDKEFILQAAISQKPPQILMVEDNLIAQKVEKALLVSLGCIVDMADSGEEALALFSPGKYDIVLMDISLQDTSGYIVSKKLREIEKDSGCHVPIIALTSYQADVVKYDCSDYFMDGVITKPLTNEQALQILQHYVYHQDNSVNGLQSG